MSATQVSSKVPFFQFCKLLDKIDRKQGNETKRSVLESFLNEWRKMHKTLHARDDNTEDSFYPAMRLLLPHLEREREAYGIKEVMLAKSYIEILGLGKTSPAAMKLLNFRAPKNAKADAGDFASVAYTVLEPRCPDKGTMTIEEVNTYLDKVAQCNANKDKAGVKKSLEHMLRNMSAREQKWLIRIIMKELKIGLSQQSVFSVFHQDAEDLFNVKMSLKKVCQMLHNPSTRLHEIEVSLFSPFRPMLGDKAEPRKVEKLMNNQPYFIETKFDGERMQLHKRNDEYKYFSRSGTDYTASFGRDAFSGTFTPHIANLFKPHVKTCILDGEMVGYNMETKTIGTKAMQFDIKSASTGDYQPMMCVFDVLLLNDKVLANKSLRERKTLLSDVFNELPGRMVLSAYKEAKTKEEAVEALNEAIDQREEGIMVKNPDSVYKPNMRKGGWYKIKPDYMASLMDDLDVLVVGGYFGVGHRSNLLSHFLCAVAVPSTDGDQPREFNSFCRVGSGYTRTELCNFNRKLQNQWQPFNKKRPPPWLHLAPGLKQAPDCFIEPAKSVLLQIRAAEITSSDQFKTECTLRFPRVEEFRVDKPWYQCMTMKELTDLREKSCGKLANRMVLGDNDSDEDDHPKRKKRKAAAMSTVRHVKPTVMARFVGVDTRAVTKVSDIFHGKEMCVINGPDKLPKAALEKKVVEYGGSIVQNPGDETYCVFVEKKNVKVSNLLKTGKYNVVKADWLIRCIEQESLVPWSPSDMLHMSAATAEEFSNVYDEYGDSYTDDLTVNDLKAVFNKMDKEGKTAPTVSALVIEEVESKYFNEDSGYEIFRVCNVFATVPEDCAMDTDDNPLAATALKMKLYGAHISSQLDDCVTHVLIPFHCSTDRLQSLQQANRQRSRKFHFVSKNWVQKCVEQGRLVDERSVPIA